MNAKIGIGTCMRAPKGYGVLSKKNDYYLLKSSPSGCLLVNFIERPPREILKKTPTGSRRVNVTRLPLPRVTYLSREDFERACSRGMLTIATEQHQLPPWLRGLGDRNTSMEPTSSRKPKRSHNERIDRILALLLPLVKEADAILASKDPDSHINAYARSCVPKQNETRLRVAFYTYLLFGRSRKVLHYAIHRLGQWSRSERNSEIKRGRPSIDHGPGHGFNATPEMIKAISESYIRRSDLGVPLTEIYSIFMVKDWGCRVDCDENGCDHYYHPLGKPYPTFGMFEYYVQKLIGRRTIQVRAIGEQAVRNRHDPSAGRFAQAVANVMERVEQDAYSVADLASGLVEGSPLPPLYVVISVDVLSRIKAGIGFSQGSETAAAYRMEKFCRAIDKVIFCALFGIHIKPWQWPSKGLSPFDIQDRGAGSTKGAVARGDAARAVVEEMSPSYAPQSRATVETSHPKKRKTSGPPHHLRAGLRTFELVRREIFRVLKENESIMVSAELPIDLLANVGRLSPNALYEELSRRGRDDSIQISFEDAVRNFLTRVPAVLRPNGVELLDTIYFSKALQRSQLLRSVVKSGPIKVRIYVLDACVRYVWLDTKGGLIQLEMQYGFQVDNEMKYLSLSELQEKSRIQGTLTRAHKEHRRAVGSRYVLEEEASFGGPVKRVRTPGRAKRGTVVARREAAEAKATVRRGRGRS